MLRMASKNLGLRKRIKPSLILKCYRYYWHYPIEHSDAPLYCYLYKQCAAGDKEPEVAMVVGGRHPGHYFITKVDLKVSNSYGSN